MIVHRNQPPNMPQPPQNEYTKGNGVFVVGLVMLLLMCSIGVWGLKGRGLLGMKGKQPHSGSLQSSSGEGSGMLSSEKADAGNILASMDSNGQPVFESKAPTGTGMPDDVREWLDHLRRAEEKREEIATQQVTEAIGMLTDLKSGGGSGMDISSLMEGGEEGQQPQSQARDPQAPGRVAGSANDMKTDWHRLIQAFNARQAPSECAEMKEEYDRVLRETGSMIEEIVSVVENIGEDPMSAIGKLEGMQGKSTSRIDSHAKSVDRAVGRICEKYDTPKWFDVKSDFGGGSLMSLGL